VSRAVNNAFAGRMWPAGREFETPGLVLLHLLPLPCEQASWFMSVVARE